MTVTWLLCRYCAVSGGPPVGFIRKMVPLMAILSARRCRASASCAARCDTVSDAPPCSRL